MHKWSNNLAYFKGRGFIIEISKYMFAAKSNPTLYKIIFFKIDLYACLNTVIPKLLMAMAHSNFQKILVGANNFSKLIFVLTLND